ncbi:MAG: hypothetical protein HLUCCX14_17280 [Marinobacter excellens HL-55]|uniref:Uncharacterized protein n=1 Tax=Marinobacter excellens HL-55 TaxID=1305731 RepID=A0A0P8BER1_9GAMM|nr:MAG: hypothetical protein HLUCCX14_17280 [Marinobacter excellens HL-55]
MNSLDSPTPPNAMPHRWLTLVLMPLVFMATTAHGQGTDNNASAFEFEQRSTIDTIPFSSIEEEALANTVIEGGLEAPAAGIPVQATRDDDFYLDPLALQPRDSRTDLGRYEIPVDIRFSNPKMIPGQSHSNNYSIRPPENRTYDTLNVNMIGR